MRTPWGDLPVSDAHVHFFSHHFFSKLAAQRGLTAEQAGALLGWEVPEPDPVRLAERWVGELDRCGIERSVLIASIPGDEDSVAAAVARFPERFRGYFLLDPCAPDAAERASRAVRESGMSGICLFPAMHRFSIQDERIEPVLAAALSRPGTVVFVHCGVLTVGIRDKLGLPSPFDLRYSNPVDLHGVALRHKDVSFVIPHFGAGYFREALMVADLCPNVYLDTSSSNSWVRYEESGCNLKTVFRRALDVVGPQRLLFGTDSSFFPRGWQKQIFEAQTTALREIGISAEDARAIFGGNLVRLAAKCAAPEVR